jgi:hypothetical protein
MSEQKLIAWRGNDVTVRIHIAARPGKTELALCWDNLSAGREGDLA